jgi:RNA recognition motif-containing protein
MILFKFRKVSASWATQRGGNNNNYSAKPSRNRSRSRENSHPKKQNSRGNEHSSYSKDSVYTIFVGNLGFKTRESKIKEFFSDCGKISNVRIGLDQDGRVKYLKLIYLE